MKQRLPVVLFLISCLPSWVFGSQLESKITNCGKKSNFSKPYQGDVFCVELNKVKKKEKGKNGKIKVSYVKELDFFVEVFGKKYFPIDYKNKLVAFIGIDYRKPAKDYPLRVFFLQEYQDSAGNKKISVRAHPATFIRVRKKYPKLPYHPPKRTSEEQAKINRESEKLNSVLKSTQIYSVQELENFRWPIKPVKITAPFGQARCQDKKKTSCRYHTGTDFRSAFDEKHSKPENVFSINDGMVVEVSSYALEGVTMVVDHGMGIKSSYFHLSKAYYKNGEKVTKIKPIARSGNTGEGNLPIHLHLMMTIHGAIVDPEKFLRSVIKK